jgi:16S rRNA (cytidine1402-2'-O)-methyltransferase
MQQSKLIIIPIPISEGDLSGVLPSANAAIIQPIRYFVVERIKTARQFLRKMDREFPIDDCTFFELDKHDHYTFDPNALNVLKSGQTIGLISEAGYPGIADPGARFVAAAHEAQAEVIPLIGPSSIFLALAASGMNGQGFVFHGYPPKKDPERAAFFKKIGSDAIKTGYAQILIETPYRNDAFMKDCFQHINGQLALTIAYNITGDTEQIVTKPLAVWKKKPFKFDKTPCVFVLGTTRS